MKKKLFYVFISLFLSQALFSEILFKVSGRVFFNGVPKKDISISLIDAVNRKTTFPENKKTDDKGDFSFFCKNGFYLVQVDSGGGYVGSVNGMKIHVNNKNILNIVLILEKACSISGYIKYQDNSTIRGARVKLFNNRGIYFCETNENGMYLINNIKFSKKNKMIVSVSGFPDQENEEIVFLKNCLKVDFISFNLFISRQ